MTDHLVIETWGYAVDSHEATGILNLATSPAERLERWGQLIIGAVWSWYASLPAEAAPVGKPRAQVGHLADPYMFQSHEVTVRVVGRVVIARPR